MSGNDMLAAQMARLAELGREVGPSAPVGSTGKPGGRGRGRHAMKPDYRNWSVSGTRPASDRGVTFHFKHSFVTKGRHMSRSPDAETAAGAHQAYIERKSAVERLEEGVEKDSEWETLDGPGNAISFGTTGRTRVERLEFWRKVEELEARNGRVQLRIIGELPCEADQATRLAIVRDFCREFEERDLPFWCAVHAPSGHNDRRNYHMHIAYWDRPAARDKDGVWDFERTEERRYANRSRRLVRPGKRPKDPDTRARDWIVRLRRHFADVANYHLALAGIDKRYDPRSYRESGIAKTPTVHLGTKASIVEVYGIDTRKGVENVRREIAFRLGSGEHVFARRTDHLRNIEKRLQRLRSTPTSDPLKNEALGLVAEHLSLSEEGRQVWRKKEAHQIGKEAVTLRIERRRRFVEKEGRRLVLAGNEREVIDTWDVAETMFREASLIREAQSDLTLFVRECDKVIVRQTRRLDGIDRRQGELLGQILDIERRAIADISASLGSAAGMDGEGAQRSYEIAYSISRASPDDDRGGSALPVDRDAALFEDPIFQGAGGFDAALRRTLDTDPGGQAWGAIAASGGGGLVEADILKDRMRILAQERAGSGADAGEGGIPVTEPRTGGGLAGTVLPGEQSVRKAVRETAGPSAPSGGSGGGSRAAPSAVPWSIGAGAEPVPGGRDPEQVATSPTRSAQSAEARPVDAGKSDATRRRESGLMPPVPASGDASVAGSAGIATASSGETEATGVAPARPGAVARPGQDESVRPSSPALGAEGKTGSAGTGGSHAGTASGGAAGGASGDGAAGGGSQGGSAAGGGAPDGGPSAAGDADMSPEERALRAILGEAPERRRDGGGFPDAMAVSARATPRQIRDFEESLARLSNRELRARALATRDAADLSENQRRRRDFAAAYKIQQDVARRRGLDLHTGRHDPTKATDPVLARQHVDSEDGRRYRPGYDRHRER